jgi:hypothetical protein
MVRRRPGGRPITSIERRRLIGAPVERRKDFSANRSGTLADQSRSAREQIQKLIAVFVHPPFKTHVLKLDAMLIGLPPARESGRASPANAERGSLLQDDLRIAPSAYQWSMPGRIGSPDVANFRIGREFRSGSAAIYRVAQRAIAFFRSEYDGRLNRAGALAGGCNGALCLCCFA